ncbi:MAG: dihydropteroate synthase [Planctomycetes bacterium]|nr:dihydropteroate synthase [Planctomycetota bacterium]
MDRYPAVDRSRKSRPLDARYWKRPRVMGVLNVTPDSFSDGGRWIRSTAAIAHGVRMARAGADIIDVGGESTRPDAAPVPADEEIRRIKPVVRALAAKGIMVSIDTSKASVAEVAFEAGAKILNDVTALADPRMGPLAARAGVAVILMHMKGTPRTMQDDPRYDDVVREIKAFLRAAIKRAGKAGIPRERLLVDPGIGFGKTAEHNLEILQRLDEFVSLGPPIAIGTSRKRFIGHVLDRPVDRRLWGTAATVATAVLRGARLVRVHDVEAMVDVVRMASLLRKDSFLASGFPAAVLE